MPRLLLALVIALAATSAACDSCNPVPERPDGVPQGFREVVPRATVAVDANAPTGLPHNWRAAQEPEDGVIKLWHLTNGVEDAMVLVKPINLGYGYEEAMRVKTKNLREQGFATDASGFTSAVGARFSLACYCEPPGGAAERSCVGVGYADLAGSGNLLAAEGIWPHRDDKKRCAEFIRATWFVRDDIERAQKALEGAK